MGLDDPNIEVTVLYSGPMDFTFHGRDSTAWRWFINGQEVIVEVTDTAMECYPDVDERTARAIASCGETEIERMLDWPIPNPHVILTTEGQA